MAEALTAYVQRQLMDQRRRIYEQPLPPLNAFNVLPPQDGVALGARQYNRRVMRSFGRAQWISNSADDLPLVGVGVIEDIYNVGMHGVAYQYGLEELRASQFAGENISDKKANAAARALQEFNNQVAWYGSAEKEITGLLSIPYVRRVAYDGAIFALGGDTDAILAVFTDLVRSVEEQTFEAEEAKTLLVASNIYNFLEDTRGNTFSDATLLELLLKKDSISRVVKVRELNEAGPNGEDMICAVSDAPDRVEHNIPDPMTILTTQERNLLWVTPMVSVTAGVISEFPKAHAFAEISRAAA